MIFHNVNVKYNVKICIGYVSKSADVGTLFSGRNSKNSSHICMRTPVQIYAHPRTIVHTRTHPHTPTEHPCTPAHTQAHPRTPRYTHAHPHTSHTYPLMPADALNLINHMKFQVNIDDREIEKGRNKSPLRQSATKIDSINTLLTNIHKTAR